MTDVAVTKEAFIAMLPKRLKNSVGDEIVDAINSVSVDPMFAEHYAENIVGFATVLQDGRFKLTDYLAAVKYVSAKMLNKTNKEAYIVAQPERYASMVKDGYTDKEISSYVSSYNRGKLVQMIMGQTIMPVHVLNMQYYQEAIMKNVSLMRTAKSEKVQQDAADSLLVQLKPPEVTSVDINIGTRSTDIIKDLEATTRALVLQQKEMLQNKLMTADDVAKSKLVIDNDTGEVDDD